jgi:hypothetical protein
VNNARGQRWRFIHPGVGYLDGPLACWAGVAACRPARDQDHDVSIHRILRVQRRDDRSIPEAR